MKPWRTGIPLLVAGTLAAALLLAACGGGDTAAHPPRPPRPPPPRAARSTSRGVLPRDRRHAAGLAARGRARRHVLAGRAGLHVDTDAKSVTGPLVAQGVDTGVKVEVRAGGPNTGFQPIPALMYVDDKITFGAVNTDDAIVQAAKQLPTVAVASQMTVSPQILMWDPATLPRRDHHQGGGGHRRDRS